MRGDAKADREKRVPGGVWVVWGRRKRTVRERQREMHIKIDAKRTLHQRLAFVFFPLPHCCPPRCLKLRKGIEATPYDQRHVHPSHAHMKKGNIVAHHPHSQW